MSKKLSTFKIYVWEPHELMGQITLSDNKIESFIPAEWNFEHWNRTKKDKKKRFLYQLHKLINAIGHNQFFHSIAAKKEHLQIKRVK